MKIQSKFNQKGVTLIELLVALVIAAITLAGVYRVFISQTRTYAVQDQVMEVQQSVRGAMEIPSVAPICPGQTWKLRSCAHQKNYFLWL